MDVGEDTAGRDGDAAEELVELFVVADGELDVARDDSALLGVLGGVACELEDLGGEVLKDGSEVHWGTGSDSIGILSLLEESSDSSDWELKSSSSSLGDWSGWGILSFSSSTFSGHFDINFVKIIKFDADFS